MVQLFYTTYINVDLEHHEIFRAKVGKGGIMLAYYNLRTALHPKRVMLLSECLYFSNAIQPWT